MSCGVGYRHSLDPALLWLCRPAATVPIQLLAWELPYAVGAALKKEQKKKRERRKRERIHTSSDQACSLETNFVTFKLFVIATLLLTLFLTLLAGKFLEALKMAVGVITWRPRAGEKWWASVLVDL